MRSLALVAAGLLATSVPSTTARAEDGGFRHGRVRYVESGVTLHRATEVSAEEALANLPFLPGDRVWTDAAGRVEFQFPDGTLVRLDSRSKLDYSGHEEGREERIVLRLWSGSLVARLRTRDTARFEIETPAGTVELLDQAMVRVDVESGEARVSVYRGEAVLDDGRERVRVAAGERTFVRWGEAAEAPQPFEIGEQDDFAAWDDARESEERWAARSSEYLPAELDSYAGELERNGSWRFEASVGYVWAPSVSVGWSPYSSGHWSWTPYGWTWVPYEPWGWAPFHYGRWGFSASFGWYWAPGRTWGPGWVSWGVGSGYVGWCALGWNDRPVYAWGGQHHGYAVPRHGPRGGWNVVRGGDFGGRDVARRRVPLTGIDPGALRVADAPNLRPTRDARALRASNTAPRAISRRPTPGDFVRELAVDNKTTIPSPWLRRGRTRPEDVGEREARDQRSGSEAASAGAPRESVTSRPRASRSVPWYAPRGEAEAPRAESAPPAAREPRQRDTQAQRRDETTRSSGRRDESTTYRPRAERPAPAEREGSSGQARYRSSPPRRDDSSSYRPRAEPSERQSREYSRAEPRTPRVESGTRPTGAEASSRPSRGDSSARSGEGQRSGGEQHARGGQRSAPRPQRERN